MKFRIWSEVSGGVTGSRAAWLKGEDGMPRTFETRKEAEAEAKSLDKRMNRDGARASFSYSVREDWR